MSKNRETLANALAHLGAASSKASKSFIYLDKTLEKVKPLQYPLKFGSHPDHKVSLATIKQLKLLLRGRSSFNSKPHHFPRHLKKQANQAFKNDAVIWQTEDNGLDYFKTIYNQTNR